MRAHNKRLTKRGNKRFTSTIPAKRRFRLKLEKGSKSLNTNSQTKGSDLMGATRYRYNFRYLTTNIPITMGSDGYLNVGATGCINFSVWEILQNAIKNPNTSEHMELVKEWTTN